MILVQFLIYTFICFISLLGLSRSKNDPYYPFEFVFTAFFSAFGAIALVVQQLFGL